jgi:hypothetical protein
MTNNCQPSERARRPFAPGCSFRCSSAAAMIPIGADIDAGRVSSRRPSETDAGRLAQIANANVQRVDGRPVELGAHGVATRPPPMRVLQPARPGSNFAMQIGSRSSAASGHDHWRRSG